jgi:hypothetical protein
MEWRNQQVVQTYLSLLWPDEFAGSNIADCA